MSAQVTEETSGLRTTRPGALRVRIIRSAGLLAAFAVSLIAALAPGVAGAHGAAAQSQAAAEPAPATCLIHSLPSFVAQGELLQTATVADVVEVECNPFMYGTGSKVTITASQLYSRCGSEVTWYVPNPFREESGRAIELTLDADGNATVALIAGPKCQAGESLISAHMDEAPFESFTTSFTVLPPNDTPMGVTALPSSQVEDSESSAVATVVEAEFPGAAEARVRLASEELYRRCQVPPHLRWVQESREIVEGAPELAGPSALQLDNNGNGFALLIGDSSCVPGSSLIEADLEEKPFTTLTTQFTVLPPQPTEEPAFSIEKRQEIAGSGGGFTTSPLTGAVGQTVDYQVTVTNTANVDETFSGFTDANCDAGTIGGGPGSSPLAPGESTVYTCRHVLTQAGTYTNEATVTGNSAGGRPLQKTSNHVEVLVLESAFKVEKRQLIAGSGEQFTSAKLTGAIGQTVDYEIIVTNTGGTALTFSTFADPRCDPGTIAGGPGAGSVAPGSSTTYTCSHVLASEGAYVNVATVTGAPPGGGPLTHESPPVEVEVHAAPAPAMTIEKLQQIAGSSTGFTTSTLSGKVGATINYEIVVHNTGNVPLTLSGFADGRCDAGTIAGGPGGSPVAPGASATYTCSHVITTEDAVTNIASVTGTPPGEAPISVTSHEVVVNVGKGEVLPFIAKCSVAAPVLRGATGPETGVFTVRVSSNGVKQVTFYLDGHKLTTMHQKQAKKGTFSIKIDARKLSYGAHRISMKTAMISTACAQSASSRVFVRPFAARVAPRFTG